jgi:hypothetical protein
VKRFAIALAVGVVTAIVVKRMVGPVWVQVPPPN